MLVSRTTAVLASATAVVTWRILAYLKPSSMIELTPGFEIPMDSV